MILTLIVNPYFPLAGNYEALFIRLLQLSSGLHFALAYHFYALYFDDVLAVRKHRFFIPVFYVWAALVAFATQILYGSIQWPILFVHYSILYVLLIVSIGFFTFAPFAICTLIVSDFGKVGRGPKHRQAKWVALGSLIGILPYLLFRISPVFKFLTSATVNRTAVNSLFTIGRLTDESFLSSDLLRLSIFASMAIPFCSAYAVLRHGAFEIPNPMIYTIKKMMKRRVLEMLFVPPLLGISLSFEIDSKTVVGAVLFRVVLLMFLGLLGLSLAIRPKARRLLVNDERGLKVCRECKSCFQVCDRLCSYDQSELFESPLPVSQLVNGQYRLDAIIGSGGMGTVFRAFDLELKRPVALKIITRYFDDWDGTKAKRLKREGRALASTKHPNIVEIFHVGTTDIGMPFLVMELIDGQCLRSVLELEKGCTNPRVCAERFKSILDGLAAMHEAGVIHRDLKPENLMITDLGTSAESVKILDMGLAKTSKDEDETRLTTSSDRLGTVAYRSPEQSRGENVSKASDLYAIGLIIVEALSGRRPDEVLSYNHDGLVFRDAKFVARNASLCKRIEKCLREDPKERYDSAVSLRLGVIPLIEELSPPEKSLAM